MVLSCCFLRPFFTTARTQARTHTFAALTTNGRFLSLQTCSACVHNYRTIAHTPHSSVLLQTSPTATVHILGYRHISACLCAVPRLLAVQEPAIPFLPSQSRMIQADMVDVVSRQTGGQAGTVRTDTHTGTCHRSKTPTLDSTESIRRDGVRWDDEMRRVRYHARMHHARLASAGGRLAPDPSPLFLRPPIPSHKRCAARSGI